jgi:hypothetical protein
MPFAIHGYGQEKLRHITYSLRCAAVAAWPTKKRSRATPFVRFFSGTFLQLLETFGFLYRNCKNVVNFSRYAKFFVPKFSPECIKNHTYLPLDLINSI